METVEKSLVQMGLQPVEAELPIDDGGLTMPSLLEVKHGSIR